MQGSEEKAAALALFELEGAVDYPAIKLRYRQLVSQHHPDRGGSTARLQSINKAMEILQRYYSRYREASICSNPASDAGSGRSYTAT